MDALAFADLHDEEAALESLSALAPSYDAVFACGDLSLTASFAEKLLSSLPGALIVPGNCDSEEAEAVLSSSPGWLHRRRAGLPEGLDAVGFGLSNPTPFGTRGELSEEGIWEGISGLPIGPRTILLLHCPPKGHFDEVRGAHVGSSSILRAIEERQPLLALCGHIHEHRGASMVGKTTLVKLPAAESMQACALSITNKRITPEFISL